MTSSIGSSGRILVVDDQEANLHVVSALLSRRGYDVATAASGSAALDILGAHPPDLILLDMLMPGMDGFDLLAEIRRSPTLAQLPVVFLTVAHDRDLLLRAFEAGAVDYVTKPFMPEELLARVEAHLGLKRMRDRLERVARERQELMTLVAHDLKNPLTSIHFASDILLAGDVGEQRRQRYLEMIRDCTADAFGYIRRYLEAQADSARARDDGGPRAAACLGEVFAWLHGRYALQVEARGARLRLPQLGDEPPRVAIDAVVLRQVCENLIGNALKYAPGSDIDVLVERGEPGFWQLRVEDRGPGIPPSRRSALFTPFFRAEARDDGVSSGLGLSLARQIVADAGGELRYEDRAGGGACFVLALPATA